MQPQPVFMMDPYVVQTLKPDHVVIHVDGRGMTFYVCIAQIVSIMPTD